VPLTEPMTLTDALPPRTSPIGNEIDRPLMGRCTSPATVNHVRYQPFSDSDLDGADVDLRDLRVSPLLVGDLSGPPPALILTGGFDPLRDGSEHFAQPKRAARLGRPPRVRFVGSRICHLVLARSRQCDGRSNHLWAAGACARYAVRRSLRRILPDVDFGIASMNST
jgi:acetyl esterase/lipase